MRPARRLAASASIASLISSANPRRRSPRSPASPVTTPRLRARRSAVANRTFDTDSALRPRDRWHAALRGCEIRPRKFYATRHTFISAALTAGLNVKFIAENTGTSLAMIEQHYGRSLEAEASAQLRMPDAAGGAKTSTAEQGLTDDAHKYATHESVPDGI